MAQSFPLAQRSYCSFGYYKVSQVKEGLILEMECDGKLLEKEECGDTV